MPPYLLAWCWLPHAPTRDHVPLWLSVAVPAGVVPRMQAERADGVWLARGSALGCLRVPETDRWMQGTGSLTGFQTRPRGHEEQGLMADRLKVLTGCGPWVTAISCRSACPRGWDRCPHRKLRSQPHQSWWPRAEMTKCPPADGRTSKMRSSHPVTATQPCEGMNFDTQ